VEKGSDRAAVLAQFVRNWMQKYEQLLEQILHGQQEIDVADRV